MTGELIQKLGRRVITSQADVRDSAALRAAVDQGWRSSAVSTSPW